MARDWIVAGGLCFSCMAARADLWSTAYYAAWLQDYMPASNVDFAAVSHVIHFAIVPEADGQLDTAVNGIAPAYSTDLVSRAHAAGAKALICVGGAGSQTGFRGATAPAYRGAFVSNLLSFVRAYGYDGVDVDWEPLDAGDASQFTNFVGALRTALTALSPHALLTAAAAMQPALFAATQDQFDQINLMTYDLSGPWGGWVTWFNAPVYDC